MILSRLPAMLRDWPGVVRSGLVVVLSMLTHVPATAADPQHAYEQKRAQMTSAQIEARGIRDPRVLEAIRKVPRHLFVPEDERADAYADRPLAIGQGQTISQPYIVALMTELARPGSNDRALEVGTGSGYQAAVLASLVDHVYTIELEETLAQNATTVLRQLGYDNVTVRSGDGYLGWPAHAPFDIVMITAAPEHVPRPLLEQLKPGGRMVVPVGTQFGGQELQLIEKDSAGKITTKSITPVRFVPLRRPD